MEKEKPSIGTRWHGLLSNLISRKTARIKLRRQHHKIFSKQHPGMTLDGSWRKENYYGVENECGYIFGHIVRQMQSLPGNPARVLLAGDSTSVKPHYAKILGIPESAITVAGLDASSDTHWNFEEAAPQGMGPFDLIVSHSIIEHLLDPYRHVSELLKLLTPGGRLLLHTVIPGFPYHAYPIDCMRFYPDWFVAVGERHKAPVLDAFTSEDHIVYTFGAPTLNKQKKVA